MVLGNNSATSGAPDISDRAAPSTAIRGSCGTTSRLGWGATEGSGVRRPTRSRASRLLLGYSVINSPDLRQQGPARREASLPLQGPLAHRCLRQVVAIQV